MLAVWIGRLSVTAKGSYQKARRSNKREATTKSVIPIDRHPKFPSTKVETEHDWWTLLNTLAIRYEVVIDEDQEPENKTVQY